MHLPPELWVSILHYLDLPDLKECRLVNKAIRDGATALVFETVQFSFTKLSVQRFEHIGAHKTLACNVKTINLRQGPAREYAAFASQESWERNLPRGKWANITSAEIKALYDEYEMDRTMLLSNKDDFLKIVVRSLEKTPNLLTFCHEPTKYDEMDWKHEWRGLRFCEDDDDDYDNESWAHAQEIEHDIDSLHTALFMQALGSVQSPKLKTISFEIYGPGFWIPSRLRHLWEGYGHGKIRELRKIYQDAAMADQKADESADDTAMRDYSTQLNTLQSIIGRVECIDLNVVERYSNGSLDTIAEPLSRFLRLGKNLKEVTLAYGNFHAYFDRDPESHRELSNHREHSRGLLAQLAVGKPWSAIVTLHISIATDSSTFLNFLDSIASTLRTLWLDSVILLPGDRKKFTWEYVLPCIPVRLSKVECLLLDNLKDFRTDGSARKLFCSSTWKCGDCYNEYEDTIVKDLLWGGKLRRSLELDMLPDCRHQ
ncbi:hypothetical protein BKA63DRAFT_197444 [Paraphoma chrysanthemicola]|nr:hypothetical protein BKA63DRAFT_227476 [Paraphoma chrysanthemicola]KAH7061839.1 hypothetical protein BKA63DRAFT_197444 [Paraphoma chrysanthemicola]